MARIRSVKVQKVGLDDLAQFSEGKPDLDLIDIINDAVKEKTEQNFITSAGAFVYEIDLAVDVQKVIDLGVEGFRIEFFRKNPRVNLKPEKVRRAKKSMHYRQRLRNYLRLSRPKPIFKTEVDLDIPLPPRNFQFTKKFTAPPMHTHSVFIDKPPQITGQMFPSKITALPLSNVTKISGVGKSATSTFRNNLFKHNADPAQMLMSPSPIFPTFAAKMSRASVPLTIMPKLDPSERISLNNIRIRRSLEDAREEIKDQVDDDSDNAQELASIVTNNQDTITTNRSFLGYVVRIQNQFQRIRRQIEIPKYRLGVQKNFYVRITPVLQKAKGWARINRAAHGFTFVVSHKKKLNDILRPEFPPEVSLIKNKSDAVVLRLKQVDPGATKIIVVRRVITKRKQKMGGVKIVKVLKVEGESPTSVVVDFNEDNVFPNRTIYRAIAADPLGNLGTSSSLVVEGLPKIVSPSLVDDPNELSIIAKNEKDGIKIEVERIPDDVVSLRLLREDIDESGDFSSRTSAVANSNNKTLIDVSSEIKKITFKDADTNLRHRYRYFAAMRASIGGEFLSEEDELITRVTPLRPLPVEISLENAQLTEDESGNFSASVDVISLPKGDGIDFVLTMMEKTGISQVFIQEMKKQRALFADLAVFIVERVDRVTGRRVSFGQHPPGQFSDSPEERRKLNLPSLQPEGRYTYFFKLCLRPPQALMKNVFSKFSTSQTPGVDNNQALAQKFMSGFAEAYGAMPSTKELIQGVSVADNFRAGETGVILEVDIRTPKPRPLPKKLRAKYLTKGRYKHVVGMTWTLEGGDINRVDHCLVFVEYSGRKICIGTVPSNGTFRRFRFLDKVYGPQVGIKKYTVQCVYDDLKLSSETAGVKMHRRSITPPRLLTGRFLGVIPGVRR